MKRSELKQKLAQLETENDHLMTEVDYVDKLMRLLGFAHGLQSIKAAAQEIIKRGITPKNATSSQGKEDLFNGFNDENQDADLV